MQLFYPNDIINNDECMACIGFFDGVHKGHRFLLNKLKETAAAKGLKTAIITFRNHPRQIINPDFDLKFLTTFEEKKTLLSSMGIDYCYVLDFDLNVRNLSSSEFMKRILSEKLNAKALLIGYDHKFGNDRNSGFEDYKRFGKTIGIEVINADCHAPQGKHISSSEIRKSLLNGDIREANNMLGSVFDINGIVVEGNRIGRTIGFPTANIVPIDKNQIIPQTGVYADFATVDNITYQGMLNIGNRPTIEKNGAQTIEVHILDYNGNLYNKSINIRFIDKIRDEVSFVNIEALKEQILKDKETIISILSKRDSDNNIL